MDPLDRRAEFLSSFLGVVFKYVPVEIIVGFQFVASAVGTDNAGCTLKKILLLICIVFIPLYYVFVFKIKKLKQIIIATIAFVLWSLLSPDLVTQDSSIYITCFSEYKYFEYSWLVASAVVFTIAIPVVNSISNDQIPKET